MNSEYSIVSTFIIYRYGKIIELYKFYHSRQLGLTLKERRIFLIQSLNSYFRPIKVKPYALYRKSKSAEHSTFFKANDQFKDGTIFQERAREADEAAQHKKKEVFKKKHK